MTSYIHIFMRSMILSLLSSNYPPPPPHATVHISGIAGVFMWGCTGEPCFFVGGGGTSFPLSTLFHMKHDLLWRGGGSGGQGTCPRLPCSYTSGPYISHCVSPPPSFLFLSALPNIQFSSCLTFHQRSIFRYLTQTFVWK